MQDEKALLAFLEGLKEIMARGGGSNSRAEYFSDQDLADRWRVSRITPWRWTRAGRFPPPVKLGDNITRWPRTVVEAWEADRAAELAAGVIPQESETAARSTLPPWTPPKLPRSDAKPKPKSTRKVPRQEPAEI